MYLCPYDSFNPMKTKMEPAMFNPSWWNGYSSKVAVKKVTDKNMVNIKINNTVSYFQKVGLM